MKVSARITMLVMLITFLASCTNHAKSSQATAAKTDSTAANPTSVKAATKYDDRNRYNDIALYLAGMKPDSFVAVPERLQKLPYYKTYCDTMDMGFNNIETTRLAKMRAWAKTEMANEQANPKTIFYPFSGPDILHCVQFFPDADQYIMMAMERYGSLPVVEKMDSLRATNTLVYIHKSLEDIIGKSYFITRKMVNDVSNQYNGVTPLACVFLVRSGHVILDIKYKHLLSDGKTMVEIPLDSVGKHTNECVEISFRKKGAEKVQKLTYFKTNLCDNTYIGPGLRTNPDLKAYLENLPECYTYAKSASYLMCQKDFSIVRNICLSKSKTILQDDTGVGFGFYDPTKWKIKLYGSYAKPIADFHGGYYQANLESAYKADSSHIKQLPFSLGYHWRDQAQNLMKFEKK